MRDLMRRHLPWVSVLLLAICARGWYLCEYATSPLFGLAIGPDVVEYHLQASRVASGHFFWDTPPIHGPLYSWLLGFFYWCFDWSVPWARVLQSALGAFAVIPVLSALRRTGVYPSSALWMAAAVWVCYPPGIFFQSELTSEALSAPLLGLSIYSAYRATEKDFHLGWAGVAGLFGGLASLTHALCLFFCVAEVVVFAAIAVSAFRGGRRTRVQAVLFPLVFLVAVSAPIIPVATWNAFVLGDAVLIQANGGFNFYLGNRKGASGGCDLRPGDAWESVHRLATDAGCRLESEKDAFFRGLAFDEIRSDIPGWLSLLVRKALLVWTPLDLPSGADVGPVRAWTALVRMSVGIFGVVGVLSLAGLLRCLTDRPFGKASIHLAALVFSLWLGQTLFETSGRYRYPMILALIPLAAAASVELWRALVCRWRGGEGGGVSLAVRLGIGVLIVSAPVPGPDRCFELSEGAKLLSVGSLSVGDADGARFWAGVAAEAEPSDPEPLDMLGQATLLSGESPAAAALFHAEALRMRPSDPVFAANMARCLTAAGDTARAEVMFELVERNLGNATPDEMAGLLYNLGVWRQDVGDADGAAERYEKCLEYDPVNAKALNNLGVLKVGSGDFRAAAELFAAVLRVQPGKTGAMLNMAWSEMSLGRRELALPWIDRALKINPALASDPMVRRMRGQKLK